MATLSEILEKGSATWTQSISSNDRFFPVILDHIDYLKANSTPHLLTPEKAYVCQYDVQRFLNDIKYRAQYAWIVLLINDIRSDLEFLGPRVLYIPNEEAIKKIWDRVITQDNTSARSPTR